LIYDLKNFCDSVEWFVGFLLNRVINAISTDPRQVLLITLYCSTFNVTTAMSRLYNLNDYKTSKDNTLEPRNEYVGSSEFARLLSIHRVTA
jgi:hypothetical protein